MIRPGYLPVTVPTAGNAGRKDRGASRSPVFRVGEYWIHAIPVIVLLCFFILWLLSRPVNVEIKDGRIVAVHFVDMLNDSQIDVAILGLASATPPIASVPLNLTLNATETHVGSWNKSN